MPRQTRPLPKATPAKTRPVPITPTRVRAEAPVAAAPETPAKGPAFFVKIDDATFTRGVDAFIAEHNAGDGDATMTRASLVKAAVRSYMKRPRGVPAV